MQKGTWIWWEPVPESRPGWMLRSQKEIAGEVVSVKGDDVLIEFLSPARKTVQKIVPEKCLRPRG